MDARADSPAGRQTVSTDLETRLEEYFEREHCVLVGRATTGLGALFEALDMTEVVFPAFCCASAVYSTEYADVRPRFCDVQADYNLCPSRLRREMSTSIDAVVACDTWGTPVAERSLQAVCDDYGAVLVEDAAQAVGSRTEDGSPTGSLGDVSVLSFGDGKPISAGHGGAILTDDPDVAAACRDVARTVPTRDECEVSRYHDLHTQVYWAIARMRQTDPSADALFGALPRLFESVYWRGFDRDWVPSIEAAMDDFDREVGTRTEQIEAYRTALSHTGCDVYPTDPDTVPFSAAVKLPESDRRAAVRDHLARQGFDPWWIEGPITRRFGVARRFPVSERLFERTLNLPLGPEYELDRVRECASALAGVLADGHRSV